MRINFGSMLKFFAEAPKSVDFRIKLVLYDAKNFVKCHIVTKDGELQFTFDTNNVKKFKDEKEMIGTICQKKFFDVISGR